MQFDLKISEGSAPEWWDAALAQLNGTLFHSTGWAQYQRRLRNATPLFVHAASSNGVPAAMAVMHRTRSSVPVLAQISGQVELSGHPVVAEAGAAAPFMEALESAAKSQGCARMVVNSNMSADSGFSPDAHGYETTSRLEFLADLSRDEESLWNAIAKDQRARIRKLERDGIVLEESTDRDDLYGLRVARESAQQRRTERGQGYELNKSDAFYARIHEDLIGPGLAKLFVARGNDDIVAAILFGAFNRRAYSIFSGSTKQGYKMGAQSGLYWTAVRYFREQGFTLLNRGGLPASSEHEDDPLHGIYRFKKRLGTEPVACVSGTKVLSPVKEGLNQFRKKLQSTLTARS